MEKLPKSRIDPPNFFSLYSGMGETSNSSPPSAVQMVEGDGGAFGLGISDGFLYHFFKGLKNHKILQQQSRFRSGFSAACANSPRVGGFLALCTVGSDVIYHMAQHFFGPTVYPSSVDLAAQAVTAGAIFAHKGPRFAVTAAFTIPALLLMGVGVYICLNKAPASIEKVNSYSYSHYRLLQRSSDGDTYDQM